MLVTEENLALIQQSISNDYIFLQVIKSVAM